jgi:multimeric flavodoxin WrbA
MRALFLNATLKPSPEPSNTGKLAEVVGGFLTEQHGVDVEHVRLVDHDIAPGVVSESVREGDAWPQVRVRILAADILVLATPTWLGQPSSVVKRALERMDAFISETRGDGTPVAFNRVAGFVVTGNEDGAHHCIADMAQAVIDLGYTVPGQAWTYWNKGPGPGEEEYGNTDEVEWTHRTGEAMAHVLAHTARALAATPIPKPPNA